METEMKIKKSLLPFLTILFLFTSVASTPPASVAKRPQASIFSGHVLGDFEGHFIECYVNHQEQPNSFPITYDDQGKPTYKVVINMGSFPIGSKVIFKINDVVVGFGTLRATHQTLDLQQDQQMH
jgi:hypothetical protein